MFRLIRRFARLIIEKVRKVEVIVFNLTMQRRGTLHSIARRGTIHSVYERSATLQSIRRRGTIHSLREVLSMSDELRRALYSSGASIDMEFSPPDLIGTSEIFTMDHREKLCSVLPARAQGYMWSLAFSTSQHGFSLASMYRKMQRVDSPVLLVIQDTDNNVFGALTSCALHPSEHFYGTGESLLFAFQRVADRRQSQALADNHKDDDPKEDKEDKDDQPAPLKTKFKYWGWTGDNMYFIRGSNDNISIGAGDGKFGLWLDGDLYLGRTQRCTTYGNEPLSTREDFIVKIMECWTFI